MDNLQYWNDLSRTDPEHTKAFKRAGGFSGTSIRPMWVIKRMTEYFGPVGLGWGWTEHEMRVVNNMAFSSVSVWYRDENREKCWVGPQWGGTEISPVRRDGTTYNDDESFKKSTTDAILKCLSYIGIAADIHMGQFDDSKYLAEVRNEYEESKKVQEASKVAASDRAWTTGLLAGLELISNPEGLKENFKAMRERIQQIEKRDPALHAQILEAYSKRKRELVPESSEAA